MAEPSASLSAIPRLAEDSFPPDHAALMALYDINYQCLIALCPPLRNPAVQVPRYHDDSLPGMPTLKLEFHEHTRHTATFGMTCRWEDTEKTELLPDVRLRLYRDSRQAELFGHCETSRGSRGAPDKDFQAEWLSRRYAGNRFLFHWLRYCLRQGYHLVANSRHRP